VASIRDGIAPDLARALLPRPPSPVDSVPLPRSSGKAPTDINLSGNSTLTIASSTTVGSIALHNNSILYVHGSSGPVTLTVLGNIRLYDHSLLFVNGSTLTIGETYDVEWSIDVKGSSQFALAGSNLTTDGYQWGAAYEDNANVTIIYSLVGYPTGWLDSTLFDAARLTVLGSWYSSDVILYDSAAAPSTSNFTAGDSAGFNVWLNFKAGTSANLSLPGLEGWRNWTFPGPAHVSNVNYSVYIADSFVVVFAVMLWQGANLTLVNSPDVALSLNVDNGTVNITGLNQSDYPRFSFDSGEFELALWNTTVFTWNIYTFGGAARISNSQIGEIQAFGATWVTVHSSTLTGDGGYYGDQSTSNLSIFDSRIEGQVVAYSGVTLLENCTVNTTYANRLLATGSGVLDAQDTWVAPVDLFQSIGSGIVNVAWSVHVNVTSSAGPAPGALVSLAWALNGTADLSGTTNASGGWSGVVVAESIGPAETLNATVTQFDSFNGTATDGLMGGAWSIPSPTAPTWFSVVIAPLILGTQPANGSTDVPTDTVAVVVEFADPMAESTAQGIVSLTPTVPFTETWDATGRNLSLAVAAALAPATVYEVEVAPGARTASGIRIAGAEVVAFTTAPAPLVAPAVVATHPANDSVNVSVSTNISVTFSVPMDPTLAAGALAVTAVATGDAVEGSTSVLGSLVVFVPSGPLSFNASYQVKIAATAVSAAGAPVASPSEFSFSTARNVSSVPPPHGPPGGSQTNQSAPPTPWVAWVVLGAVLALIVVAAVLLALRRRRGPPPTPMPAAPSPAPPPAWSEDEPSAPTP
jgi:Big-like domain-containing protein